MVCYPRPFLFTAGSSPRRPMTSRSIPAGGADWTNVSPIFLGVSRNEKSHMAFLKIMVLPCIAYKWRYKWWMNSIYQYLNN